MASSSTTTSFPVFPSCSPNVFCSEQPSLPSHSTVTSVHGGNIPSVMASVPSQVSPVVSSTAVVIPPLPAGLMIPPATNSSIAASHTVSCGASSTVMLASEQLSSGNIDSLHHNLDKMKLQLVRETDALQGLQSQLSAREHEMDRLKAELEQHEQRESQHKAQDRGPALHSAATHGMPAAMSRTVTMATHSAGTKGYEFALQQQREQTEDLKLRLRMTTELCAKQDAYYRDVVRELEDRLQETVSGRDHILALRETEARNQLNLVRQLEAALKQQQQTSTDKDETIACLERRVSHLEQTNSTCSTLMRKLQRVLQEQQAKRGLAHVNYDTAQEISSHMADAVMEGFQKCLFDDENEKQLLNSKLHRMEAELEDTKRELHSKLEELKKDQESRISTLKEDHAQALDIAASRSATSREELENLRQQMEVVKKQHVTEVSALDDKIASLRLDLQTATAQRDQLSKELEAKCSDFQTTSQNMQVELNLLREEKEKLLGNSSREQATSMVLQEKLSSTEKQLASAQQQVVELSEENKVIQRTSTEEMQKLRADIDETGSLLQQKELEFLQQAQQEIQNATKEEQEKSESRLNIILVELNKLNVQVTQLTSDLETKNAQLNTLNNEYKCLKETLELKDKEIGLIREEKMDLATRYDERVKEIEHLNEDVASKTGFTEEKLKDLESAQAQIEKLQTQLEERERTITSFKEQGTNLAEILKRNNQTGDSLQRERQELIQKLQAQIEEVQQMKRHREILAKKLKSKDKRVNELENELQILQRSVTVKGEELAALVDDRDMALSELKARQMEVGGLRDERDTLNAILEGKDGEREKEISKLLSRLKGSEQDLTLTKKLLKAKGEMSGKAVRVAESTQRQITEKRAEVDSLHNKIHWLQESLNTAAKDKRYFECKSVKLAEELVAAKQERDQLRFQSQQIHNDCEGFRKQAKHLEQALEKAALKHVDNQAEIERLGQDNARLKLKHSLQIKELERTSVKVDAASVAEILTRVNAGLRLPLFGSQVGFTGTVAVPQKSTLMSQPITLQNVNTPSDRVSSQQQTTALQSTHYNTMQPMSTDSLKDDDPNNLKSLLQDVRSLVSDFQAHFTQQSAVATSTMPPVHVQPRPQLNKNIKPYSKPSSEAQTTSSVEQLLPKKPKLGPKLGTVTKYGEPGSQLGTVAKYESCEDDIDSFWDSSSESEFDKNIDLREESIENFRPPLGSSSPKPDKIASYDFTTSFEESHRPVSPKTLDLSDVTSLLSNHTVDASVDVHPLMSVTAKAIARGERGTGATSTRQVKKGRGQQRDEERKDNGRTSDSPPSYQRAEMILQSLTKTGSHLTRKNKEIANLLHEQDRRIKKCRENGHGIQSMLR